VKKSSLPEISEESLATTLEVISDGIWDWNANTGYVYRSPGWYLMLGYEIDAFENTVFTWESVIHPDDFDRVMLHFDDYITHKSQAYKIQYRCHMKNGDYLWIEDRGKVVEWNDDGTIGRMVGAHRDISTEMLIQQQSEEKNTALKDIIEFKTKELVEINKELARKVSEVQYLAITDSLTLLSNRYQFEKQLKIECARAERFNEPLSLAILDLDNFKPVNDKYGHASGDLVLLDVAKIIRSNIREIDLGARWGGDEFVVLLPNTPLDKAVIFADKIRQLIDNGAPCKEVSVTASIGVAQFEIGEEPLRLTIRADKALYQSKDLGRNRVTAS